MMSGEIAKLTCIDCGAEDEIPVNELTGSDYTCDCGGHMLRDWNWNSNSP
jgi:transposase